MACAHPFEITPKFRYKYGYEYYPRSVKVPCGYCLNCRRDRQNFIVDRANYEYCQRLTASFVTFTYDDIHLLEHCAVFDANGKFIYDKNDRGVPYIRTTLNYRDLTKFIDNIRHYIKNHPEMHNILCQPDFSYLYCGEYGDSFGRCHFHVLFFGLDFAYCKKLFFDNWKHGFIDVLPLLDGGIRYVTKYMDKFEKGLLAELKYDFKGMARPRLGFSQGFGQGLLWSNLDDIKSHDWTYKSRHNLRRPVPQYWRLLVTGNFVSRDPIRKNWYSKTDDYLERVEKRSIQEMRSYNLKDKPQCHYWLDTQSAQSAFRLRQARIRERQIELQLHNNGVPVAPFESVVRSRFGFVTYDQKRLRRSSVRVKRELVELYLMELFQDIPDYFVSKEVS